jgi:hypothetical protein
MTRQRFKAITGLKDAIREVDDSLRGRMAHVVETRGHMVKVAVAGEDSEADRGWYPSSGRHLPVGQPGVLLPLLGTGHFFIPVDITTSTNPAATLQDNLYVTGWHPGRYLGARHYVGALEPVTNALLDPRTTYASPFLCPKEATVDALAFYVNLAVAGSNTNVAIYETTHTGFASNQPIATGNAATATNGTKVTGLSPEVTLKPNHLYWLAIEPSHAIRCTTFTPTRSVMAMASYAHAHNYGIQSQQQATHVLSPPSSTFTSFALDLQLRRKA